MDENVHLLKNIILERQNVLLKMLSMKNYELSHEKQFLKTEEAYMEMFNPNDEEFKKLLIDVMNYYRLLKEIETK